MGREQPRILVVGAWPPTPFLARLFDGLLDEGLEVAVASRTRPSRTWLGRAGFSWVRIPRPGRRGWLQPLLRLRAAMAASRVPASLVGRPDLQLCAASEADAIYFPWNGSAIDAEPLLDVDRPVIVSCRGRQVNVGPWDPQRPALREGLRRTLSRAAAVHCVSDAIRLQARRWGLPDDGGVVIRPAVPVPAEPPSRPARKAKAPLRAISVGALEWRKGYADALAAVARLRDAGIDVEYTIVGGGEDEERLRFEAFDLGITDRVVFRGHVSADAVPALLAQADVFLLPSLTEGIANAALEAMAQALPVVSTRCGGMEEVFVDTQNGRLVPTRDPEALAEAVAWFHADGARAAEVGRAGWETVSTHHRIEDQVTAFAALVRTVVGEATS